MTSNPILGVILHAIGGLCSATFYLPYRKVRHWAWESYWIVGGLFSWAVAPVVVAAVTVPEFIQILRDAPAGSLFWSYFFGLLWGVGGLTFGLTMRYLGLALGNAMALGYCAVFGTLIPPLFSGEFGVLVGTPEGKIILAGVAVCVTGIAISGLAGVSKEREQPEEEKRATIREFSFFKGFWVATFCGIMSACMSYGFAAGKPIAGIALQHGTLPLWQNLPVLVVILAGGLTSNLLWCFYLNVRNGSWRDYINRGSAPVATARGSAPKAFLARNYLLCAVAGTTWYLQFFFYSMGSVQMGRYDFSSWTLHMASIMIFGTLWGAYLQEWRGSGPRTLRLRTAGLIILVLSTLVVGYGNYCGADDAADAVSPTSAISSAN